MAQASATPSTNPPPESTKNCSAASRQLNTPVTTAAVANLNATSPEASLIRLSPLTIVATRAGILSLPVTALTATASVGETTAPSANAAASGSSGTSQCSKYPTASTVKSTRPKASSNTGRRTPTRSRFGMTQASAKSNGGMNSRKKTSGGTESEPNAGRYESATPAPT